MISRFPRILLIGYGNPARCDDGLGPALAVKLELSSMKGLTVESDYQLTLEDAHDVSKHDIVIFADAALTGTEPFSFQEIESRPLMSITSHSVSPESVLYCAQKMFCSRARAYVLAIRGYEFNRFGERLSEGAQRNLGAAFQFIEHLAQAGWRNLREHRCRETCGPASMAVKRVIR